MRKLLLTISLIFIVQYASAWAQVNTTVFNYDYVFGLSDGHAIKIATLAASNAGTYDHLHLVATVNPRDLSNSNASIDAVFGNRDGFRYSYSVRGDVVEYLARLVAYENADTSVDIYLVLGNGYVTGGYTVLENLGDTVYSSPVDTLAATPPGTLVFDSSSPSYPPATYTDFSGNLSIYGNVGLRGTGASLTFPDGTVQSTAWTGSLCGGDYAESVDVSGDRARYEPGDVLIVDTERPGHFLKAANRYSKLVAGIYSTKPGLTGRRQTTDPKTSTTEVPMAMVGIVPTKVSAESGPIRPGDLLVTSSIAGRAMKGADERLLTGAIVGKALGSLESGTGVIEVLVSLQ